MAQCVILEYGLLFLTLMTVLKSLSECEAWRSTRLITWTILNFRLPILATTTAVLNIILLHSRYQLYGLIAYGIILPSANLSMYGALAYADKVKDSTEELSTPAKIAEKYTEMDLDVEKGNLKSEKLLFGENYLVED